MKISLITANIGSIDDQHEVPEQTVPHERLYFTENTTGQTDRMAALYYKTQPHKFSDADIFIWIDAKIKITSPDFIQQCLDALGDGDLAIIKHHERNCVYDEINHILHCMSKGNEYLLQRYKDKPMKEQLGWFESIGYPKKNGLHDCKIIVARNSLDVKSLFDNWHYYVKEFDYFDQTTIHVLSWARFVKITPIIFKPGSFEDVPHKVLK